MNAAGSGMPAVKLSVSAEDQSRLHERRHATEKPDATEETAQGSTEDQAGRTLQGQLQGHMRAWRGRNPGCLTQLCGEQCPGEWVLVHTK